MNTKIEYNKVIRLQDILESILSDYDLLRNEKHKPYAEILQREISKYEDKALEIMKEIKQRIDDSATIEDFLSKYVSLTVH